MGRVARFRSSHEGQHQYQDEHERARGELAFHISSPGVGLVFHSVRSLREGEICRRREDGPFMASGSSAAGLELLVEYSSFFFVELCLGEESFLHQFAQFFYVICDGSAIRLVLCHWFLLRLWSLLVLGLCCH